MKKGDKAPSNSGNDAREAAARRNLQTNVANDAIARPDRLASAATGARPTDSPAASSSHSLPVSAPPPSTMFPPLVLEKQNSFSQTKQANLNSSAISHELLGQLCSFYKQSELTDAEIHIQGRTIKVHRVVLAAASDFFKAMFSLNMSEKSNGKVQLHDLDPCAVQTLVDFAYSFEIKPPLTVENVHPLLCAASILQFNKVLSICSEFIESNLDPKHALAVLPIAEHFGLQDLLRVSRSYIARNYHACILQGAECFQDAELPEDFIQLSEDDLIAIFSDKELVVRNETILVDCLFKWAQFNPVEEESDEESLNPRHDSVRRILRLAIRLAYLPSSYLYRLLRNEPIISHDLDDHELRDLLEDALICQLSSNDERQSSQLIGVNRLHELRNPRSSSVGCLVCVGGRQASSEPFRSAECFDATMNRWLRIPDMNSRRRHVGVAVGSKNGLRGLYAVGGHDGSRHLDTVEVLSLDPGSKWRPVASLHTLRRGLAVTSVQIAECQSLLFAIGGLDDQSCFPHVEIYDPELDSWSFGPAMSQSRGGVAAASIQTRVYAVGGNDGSYSVDSGEVLDPVAGRWMPIARMRHRRAGAGLNVMSGCLWVAGGFDENVPLKDVEFYDPRLNAWQRGPNMRTARGGVGLAAMGNCIYAVGGHDGNDYLASVECFDPRMFVASIGSATATPALSPGSAYNAGSSSASLNAAPSGEWEFIAQLSNGRAGAGLVHVSDVIPMFDLPIIGAPVHPNQQLM